MLWCLWELDLVLLCTMNWQGGKTIRPARRFLQYCRNQENKPGWKEYSEEKSKSLLTKWLIKATIEVSNLCLFCVKHCKYIYLIPAGHTLLFQVLKVENWGTERYSNSRHVTQPADPSARPSDSVAVKLVPFPYLKGRKQALGTGQVVWSCPRKEE